MKQSLEILKSLTTISRNPKISAKFARNPEIPVDFCGISYLREASYPILGSEMRLALPPLLKREKLLKSTWLVGFI